MAISVSCESCGKAYQVSEERAGKKVRCKCGEPLLVPAVERDPWETDDAVEDDAPAQAARLPAARLPARVTRREKPSPKPKRAASRAPVDAADAHERADQQRSGARNFGLSMMGTGVALLVLPLFGVQLRRAGNLGPQGALIVGGVLFAIGALSFGSASLITVKPAKKRRLAAGAATETEADAGEINNPGERAAKMVLWAIIIAMLAVPAFLLGLPFLAIVLMVLYYTRWFFIPFALGCIALYGYLRWRRRRTSPPARRSKRAVENDADENEE